MALIARSFIDTSAAARMHLPIVAAGLAPLIRAGVVATCAVLDAEALDSARTSKEYEQLRADRRTAYEYIPTGDEDWARALKAQRFLSRTGRHRAVGMFDLLIAVLAARDHLTVLHYDSDFELAAEALGCEHRWVAERGSL